MVGLLGARYHLVALHLPSDFSLNKEHAREVPAGFPLYVRKTKNREARQTHQATGAQIHTGSVRL